MHLKTLCFILPSEFDESGEAFTAGSKLHPETANLPPNRHRSAFSADKFYSETTKPPPNRGCGAFAADYLRELLHRFFKFRCLNNCNHNQTLKKQFSAGFYDAEGVQLESKNCTHSPRIFSYSELYIGSNGFSETEVLGSGGFGRVYRAILPSDGTAVAVKCLVEREESFEKSFMAELMAVAHLRHRNLVRLRGWCIKGDELLLVYDYMPNRSLDRVLFHKSKSMNLSWERRKNIINGLASALNYLHENLETQIIHRDVKTSNVMLDSNFNARLGDFGLARWLEHDLEYKPKTPLITKDNLFRLAETTRIGGTIGYLPPESFQKRSIATAKSDVFSFGIVVLEVVSGRRAVDLTYSDDQIVLLDLIRRLSDEGTLLQGGDHRLLDGSYKLSEMERLIKLGLMCTLHDPQARPSMKWVVEVLFGNVYGELPNLPSFRSHPLYISLSSSTTNTTSSGTTTSKSSTTTSVTTSAFHYTEFVSANTETIYLSAESNPSSSVDVSMDRCCSERSFPVVETPRVISFDEIISATNNFADSHRVAEVDFGTAYRGFLCNRYHVIIKRLGMKTCPALRMRFADEFRNMGRLRHRNLILLRGWCTEQGEMLVVYDYSANRLLSHILFHHEYGKWQSELQWRHRYNIIKSLASAIYYLHEEWDEQVIHRNITSSAIILDQDMNPRLGSFALAEFLTRNEHSHHVVVDKKKSVRGIFGYISPEYSESGEATTKADVYSFGVVLLEVVTGQMAVDFRRTDVLLVNRVQKFVAKKRPFAHLVDWRLDGRYDHQELERVLKLGIACTLSDPEMRPSMRQIVSILNGYDEWLLENSRGKKEKKEEWKRRNECSLCLIRRIQAIGIH